MKSNYLTTMYIGDTKIDVHGSNRHYIEEIYISGTDVEISEMIHSLVGWDKFKKLADEAIYEDRKYA